MPEPTRRAEPAAPPTAAGPSDPETVVFLCGTCGAELTGPLRRLPRVPEPPYHPWWEAEQMGPSPATVPSGCYAVEAEPYGPPLVVAEAPGPVHPRHGTRHDREGRPLVSAGPRGTIVVNPGDVRGLELRHASPACCGATPDGGPNQVCGCGALVAILCSDCCLPYELHLVPGRVRAVVPHDTSAQRAGGNDDAGAARP